MRAGWLWLGLWLTGWANAAEVPTTYRLQLSKPGLVPPAVLLLPGKPVAIGVGGSPEDAAAQPSRFDLLVEGERLTLRQLGEGDAVVGRLALAKDGGRGALGGWQVELHPALAELPSAPMYTLSLERADAPKGRRYIVEAGTTLSFHGARFRLEQAGEGLLLLQLGEDDAVDARLSLDAIGGSGVLGSWQATLSPMDAAAQASMRQLRETNRLGFVRELQTATATTTLPTVAHAHRVDLRAADALLSTGQPASLPQTLVFDADQRLILLSSGYKDLATLKAKIDAARQQSEAPALTLAQALTSFRHTDGAEIGQVPAGGLYLLQAWAPWCAPCLKERDDLAEYFQANPDSDWVWFHAEADAPAYRRQRPADGG